MAKAADSFHQEVASGQKRDEFGRFFKLAQDENGEELVDVKIHNPFKRLYALLQQIKAHQRTTFGFKISIPLLALPIVLAFVFGLGGFGLARIWPLCQETQVTMVGTVYSLGEVTPASTRSWIPFWPQPSPTPVERVILYREQETLSLRGEKGIDLGSFHGQVVAVVGKRSECTGTLRVERPADVNEL